MDILSFLGRKPQPRDIARERLKLVLIHDRCNLSPQMMEMLRIDIIRVISNYVEIDEADMEINFTHSDVAEERNVPMLLANIPIKRVRKAPRKS